MRSAFYLFNRQRLEVQVAASGSGGGRGIVRVVLVALGALYLATGLLILCAPAAFVRLTPGVAETGPINAHFLTDVGLAFAACAALLLYGGWTGRQAVAAAGALWLVLHALFHLLGLVTRAHHANPADWVTVVLPAAVLVAAIYAMRRARDPAGRRGGDS